MIEIKANFREPATNQGLCVAKASQERYALGMSRAARHLERIFQLLLVATC